MDILTKFFTPGIIFLLTLVLGVWLSYSGKPYNGILFNIHKLIALGAVVITGMQVYKLLQETQIDTLLIVLVILTGLWVVTLFATGAMMSAGKLDYKMMLTLHKVMPFLTAVTMALTIYLLTGKYNEI
jgi:hypothetical protein